MDNPETGDGDLEILDKIRVNHTVCESPVAIECREAIYKDDSKSTNQTIICDQSVGLECYNRDNVNGCFDYEVRFFCVCGKLRQQLYGAFLVPM